MALAASLCSCGRSPQWYAPPAQYAMPAGPEPQAEVADPFRPVLAMSDSDIDTHIVQDVSSAADGEEWRWTSEHPKFRLTLRQTEGLDFVMRFMLASQTLRDTGPVTITIRINGQVLDQQRFDKPGEREYLHPLPAGLLKAQEPVVIALDVQPPWVSPDNPSKLGILLYSIGFVGQGR